MPKGKAVERDVRPRSHLTKPTRSLDDSEPSSSEASNSSGEEDVLPSKRSLKRALKAHRLRFIDYMPAAISSLALTPHSFSVKNLLPFASSDRQLLAVGKADGTIEIYVYIGGEQDTSSTSERKAGKKLLKTGNKQTWILWTVIPAPLNAGNVERLVWTHRSQLTRDEIELWDEGEEQAAALLKLKSIPPRLFSTNGTCDILEWQWYLSSKSTSQHDTRMGDVRRKLTVTNESATIFDLAANPSNSKLAAACSDGSIHIIDILDEEFTVLKTLDLSSSVRLLSITWGPMLDHQHDSYLIAGCSDSSLRKWDARSGRCVARMTLDKLSAKQHTFVWTVVVNADHQIVSGDSLGNVIFWDGKSHTQLSLIKAHKSDVMALTIAPDGKRIYSASTDQRICEFTSLATSGRKSWTLSATRRVHSHDIRALLCSPSFEFGSKSHGDSSTIPLLLSGGLDMAIQLTPCSTFTKQHVEGNSVRLGPLSNSADMSFATGQGRALSYVNQSANSPLISYSRQRDLLFLRKADGCSIWRFSPDRHGNATHTQVLSLKVQGMTTSTVGCISPDGHWMILGDLWRLKLWKLVHPETKHKKFEATTTAQEPVKIKAIKSFETLMDSDPLLNSYPFLSATSVHFTADSRYLAFGSTISPEQSAQIIVIQLPCADNDHLPKLMKVTPLVPEPSRVKSGNAKLGKSPINGHVVKNGSNGVHINGHGKPTDLGMAARARSSSISSQEGQEDSTIVQSGRSATDGTVEPFVVLVRSSPDGKWLAVAKSNCSVSIYIMASLKLHCRLPSFTCSIADMGFLPGMTNYLLIGQKNCQLYVYDVQSKSPAAWAEHFNFNNPQALSEARDELLGIAFEPVSKTDPKSETSIVCWGASFTTSLRVPSRERLPATQSKGIKRTSDDQERDTSAPNSFSAPKLTHKFSNLLGAEYADHGELWLVERPFGDISSSGGLPPAVFTRRYGQS